MKIVLSCEHAVNHVPEEYAKLFENHGSVLNTHEAIDLGAKQLGLDISRHLNIPFIDASTSRLIIDCNRSLHHKNCFSIFTKPLSLKQKKAIIGAYYTPYRQTVNLAIKKCIQSDGFALHLSIHSFTPVLNQTQRNADIGLLYDPKRSTEKQIASKLQSKLRQITQFNIRRNYPYLGKNDGLTKTLRAQYENTQYAGIEIEVNQKWLGFATPTFCGLSAESIAPADKPRGVEGGVKCQQTLVNTNELSPKISNALIEAIESLIN